MDINTSETLFKDEYAIEVDGWFRRRFRNLCITLMIILLFSWSMTLLLINSSNSFATDVAEDAILMGMDLSSFMIYGFVAGGLEILIVLWFFFRVRPRLQTRKQLINASTLMMRALSIMQVLALTMIYQEDLLWSGVGELFFWHFIACLFLPWTAWESLKALGPAYILMTVITIGSLVLEGIAVGSTMIQSMLFVGIGTLSLCFLSLIFLPGMLICWLRIRKHGRRFKLSMLSRKYLDLRQDMAQARKIHDALFPREHTDDEIAFEFDYTPYSEIGGDFVWFERVDDRVIAIILDVTGHGLPAAMTVNRISGEIERLRSEYPDGDPLVLMTRLSRYFSLTMAPHRIFATGIACELDLRSGALKWVNSGHPPGFIISETEKMIELGTTAMMLGATNPEEFEIEQEEIFVSEGDLIGLYTDGVTEARSANGEMLGLKRLRQYVQNLSNTEKWAKTISASAQEYSRGMIDDDILVASIQFKNAVPALSMEPFSRLSMGNR